ncbi:MAG: MFS transporter [Chloroflexi bacterium]|nr:MFS transporter [Chloroflexota bacterium]
MNKHRPTSLRLSGWLCQDQAVLGVGLGALSLSLFALCYGLLSPALPLLASAFGIGLVQQGSLMTAYAVGYLFAVVFGGYLADRWSKERVLTCGLGLIGAGLVLTWAAPNYVSGLAALGVTGGGGGLIEMVVSAIVSDYVPDRRGSALNLLQLAFGLSAASPIILTWLVDTEGSWRLGFVALGGIAWVLGLLSLMLTSRGTPSEDRIDLRAVTLLARRPRLWAIAASQAAYVFSEVSLLSWSITFLVSGRGISAARANGALSLFWVALLAGRMLTTILAVRIRLDRLLILMTVAAMAGVVTLVLVADGEAARILVGILGFLYAGIFGTIIAYAGDEFPRYSGTVFGLIMAAGAAGAVIGPWAVGAVAEAVTLEAALWLVAATMGLTGVIYMILGSPRQI